MRLLRRLAYWLRLSSRQTELQDELAHHRELIERDLIQRGMSPADARAKTRRTMGNETYMREEARAVWLQPSVEAIRQDATYALRAFRRDRVFTAGVMLTLALGIGATGAVFSILQAALLQPLPYRNPSELVVLQRTAANRARSEALRLMPRSAAMTAPMVLAWRQEATTRLGEVAALLPDAHDGPLDITIGDRTDRLNAAGVTPNFFDVLGVRAARGRVFSSADETSSDQLILLSDALSRRLFGRNPAIVGRSITLTGGAPGTTRTSRSYIIAGILPRGFHYTYPDEVEAWVLTRWADVERYHPGMIAFSAVARLRPGISLETARRQAADLSDGSTRSTDERRRDPYRSIIGLERMHDWVVGETRPSLQLLGAVAALLLVITCITVANGLLARFSERRQELAVRTALGAGRTRLVRQLLTEGALLSIGGAAAGMLLAIMLQPLLRVLLPASVPRVGDISVNAYVVAFGAVMAAVTTMLAAVAPAWGGTRLDAAAVLTRAMSAASAGRSTARWRQGLVAAQAAIATALLVSASLLLASFWQLRRVPLGYDGNEIMTVELRLFDVRYGMGWAMQRFQNELIDRVRGTSGVADVATTSTVPFRGTDWPVAIKLPGVEKPQIVRKRVVDPGFFRVLRVPVIRGRPFTDADRLDAPPVTIITESLARQAFGSEDPIGKTIGSTPVMEVVGVVRDLYHANLEQDPIPAFYQPRAQEPRNQFFTLIVRPQDNVPATSLVPAIRHAITEIDPQLPAINFATIDRLVDASVANRRFYTVATVAFAAVALLLTIVGLLVVVARVVAERRRELAIRSALGATWARLVHVATRDALVAVGLGVAVGLSAAYAVSGVLARFLFHVAPRSPSAYAAVALLVLIVAALAAWGPVRRFNRLSLVSLLKAE